MQHPLELNNNQVPFPLQRQLSGISILMASLKVAIKWLCKKLKFEACTILKNAGCLGVRKILTDLRAVALLMSALKSKNRLLVFEFQG